MNLKYKSQIEYLASKGVFLPDLYEPNGKDGYRFCFSEDKEKNHIPIYIQTPQRAITDIDKERAKTSGYALSFFNAEDKAIIKINILRKTNKNIYVTLGDSICKGSIDNNLGLITMHTKDGHFDLYEYVNCDLSATFVIYKKLKDE